MIIDIFKDRQVFDSLEQYNQIIKSACATATFARPGTEYDIPNNHVSYWFDPDYLRQLPIVKNYPRKSPEITFDSKWNLLLFFANYLSLYLTNLLYADRKEILVEDMAGGMGALVMYLSKLGFYKFHITEEFTQVSHKLLQTLMDKAQVHYVLNMSSYFWPTVINLSEWTHITRTWVPESCELICLYNNPGIWYVDHEMLYVRSFNGHIAVPDFVKLCSDLDGTSDAFCHIRKYDEFSDLLRSRKVVL